MDFTLSSYRNLLESLKAAGYSFVTFYDFIQHSTLNPNSELATRNPERFVILRHDVDLKPQNSLHFAQIQHQMGIRGTYYFRIVPQSYQPHIVGQIVSLGHEVGYHYEDIDLVPNKSNLSEKQIAEQAIILFEKHLTQLRKHFPVTSICMHGSPMSRYDNKLVWKHYNYRDFGIIAEPYFDVDYNKVFYITDTGRRWNGSSVSVRDKVQSTVQWPRYKRTIHIIDALNNGSFPQQAILTFHPQRWTNSPLPWAKELVWQSLKNIVKRLIVRRRH